MPPPSIMISALLIPTLLGACTSTDDPTRNRQLIIGFGWVDGTRDRAVEADSVTAVGVVVDHRGLKAGIIQSHRTAIDPEMAGDAIIEVEASAFHLKTKSRKVTSTN